MIAGPDWTLPYEHPPILVCVNFQIEYLAGGPTEVAGMVTSKCLGLLSVWRAHLWPVMHLKRIARAAWFDPASNLSDWIAEFRPRPGELVFEHPLPSAYSSARFAEYMSNMKSVRCLMAGFSLDETVLATVVEGFHRGHGYQVVADAASCSRPSVVEAASHNPSMVRAIGNFAGVVDSDRLIAAGTEAAI